MTAFQTKIHVVVAMGCDRAIGVNNGLLWKCSSDMKHFRELTTGKIILAGYNTAESFGRALPNRTNLVLTSREVPHEGMIAVRSINEAVAYAQARNQDLYVVGGGKLYEAVLPIMDVFHITTITSVFPEADTWFPAYSLDGFIHDETTGFAPGPKDEYGGLVSRFYSPRYYGSENPTPSVM